MKVIIIVMILVGLSSPFWLKGFSTSLGFAKNVSTSYSKGKEMLNDSYKEVKKSSILPSRCKTILMM